VKTSEVVEAITQQRARLLDAVDALGERASTQWVTEPNGWTAKDVLAHLIHYAGQVAFGLGAQIQPPAYVLQETTQLSGQEWNERAVAFWKDTPLEDVRAEFVRNVDAIIERARLRSDDEMLAMDAIPWALPGRPLWEFIGYDTFLHEWPAHSEQIEQAAIR
jgi:hypothetical protein